MENKGKKIFIVASDPGGAQAVLAVAKKLKAKDRKVVVIARNYAAGFAREMHLRICEDKAAYGGKEAINSFLKKEQPDFIITATSLLDNLERDYLSIGRRLGIPTLTFIDWWVNYKERFVHTQTQKLSLPDWICVVDEIAKRECRKALGEKVRIAITGNPYFSLVSKNIRQEQVNRKKTLVQLGLDPCALTVLYVTEPKEPDLGYDQFQIFRQVAQGITQALAKQRMSLNLIVKLHPSGEEPKVFKKFRNIAQEILNHKCQVRFTKRQFNIGELIESSDYLWGTTSTPLVEGMIRKKPVSSFLHQVNFFGMPFSKEAGFCASAQNYKEYPKLIENLLGNRKFSRRALLRQNKYQAPKEDFVKIVSGIVNCGLKKGR